MTCRYSNTNWLDVLYTSVRNTDGGVAEAARFLTERRGRSIHPETLRAKLRGIEGESITVEMADLLTEWMETKAGAKEYARDWIAAFAAMHGMAIDAVPATAEEFPCEISAIQMKVMRLAALTGGVASVAAESVADGQVDAEERDRIVAALRDLRETAHKLERKVGKAARRAK